MDEQKPISTFDLDSYKRAAGRMIRENDSGLTSFDWESRFNERFKDYTPDEIRRIVANGSLSEQRTLSRAYFKHNGYYKQILMYYATLLKYAGLLIPNPGVGKHLSTPHIAKKYYSALKYIDCMEIPVLATRIAERVLCDGEYFGILANTGKNEFALIDAPVNYTRSRYKDLYGNDILEFNVGYFNSISNLSIRASVLDAYPKSIQAAYKRYVGGKMKDPWVEIEPEYCICLNFFDRHPVFLSVIPATLDYEAAIETEHERALEEIHKIIVQKMPHLTDGRLLFEPDEAEEFHHAAVGMLKGNKNNSVLTTYADVEAINASTNKEGSSSVMAQLENNIYSQAGMSGQIFASTGSSTLKYSISNDIAFMMVLANKLAHIVTYMVNANFSNNNIDFAYTFLPVSYLNETDYTKDALQMANSGYSFLIPAAASGITQSQLSGLKELENDVLKLDTLLKPLSTSYTQSNKQNEGGRPAMDDTQKQDTTITKETSLDNQTEGT